MNTLDKMKFITIFVDVIKYDKKVPCSMSEVDAIIPLIKEDYLNNWEKYLYHQSGLPEFEDEDAWDDWYDNLDFEDLDERDIRRYDLPTDKIQVELENSNILMSNIHKVVKEFFNDATDIVNSDKKENPKNFHFSYSMDRQGVFAEIGANNIRSGNKTYKQLKDRFDLLIKDIDKAVADYNKVSKNNTFLAILPNKDKYSSVNTIPGYELSREFGFTSVHLNSSNSDDDDFNSYYSEFGNKIFSIIKDENSFN